MLTSLTRYYHHNRHIIITRLRWRVIAEQVPKPQAVALALVDCGDLLMRAALFGKLGKRKPPTVGLAVWRAGWGGVGLLFW